MNRPKVLNDIGPCGGALHPAVSRWSRELSAIARSAMTGPVTACVWPYRDSGGHGYEMLAVDMRGADGGDFSITFGTGCVENIDYDFGLVAGDSCVQVPDLTDALTIAAILIDDLSASVTLPTPGIAGC